MEVVSQEASGCDTASTKKASVIDINIAGPRMFREGTRNVGCIRGMNTLKI
jgi:hypothetical protein